MSTGEGVQAVRKNSKNLKDEIFEIFFENLKFLTFLILGCERERSAEKSSRGVGGLNGKLEG